MAAAIKLHFLLLTIQRYYNFARIGDWQPYPPLQPNLHYLLPKLAQTISLRCIPLPDRKYYGKD